MAQHFIVQTALSAKQSITHHGYLLCRDVPLARTGELLYGAHEIKDVEPSRDGIVRVQRTDEEVFHPSAIASFEHSAVTIEHPEEFVGPGNWSGTAVGFVQNVRQGKDGEAHLLLGDLVINDQKAIELIRVKNQREVSCGYDSDVVQLSPGVGKQINIRGNHVALVPRGRCGIECAIGDKETIVTKTVKKRGWADKILTAFKAKDEEALAEAIEEAKEEAKEEGETQTVVIKVETDGTMTAGGASADRGKKDSGKTGVKDEETEGRLGAVEVGLNELKTSLAGFIDGFNKKFGDGGKKDEETAAEKEEREKREKEARESGDSRKIGDSADFINEWQDVVSRTEIIAPGLKVPTRDAQFTVKSGGDALCAMRVKALDAAYARPEGKVALDAVLNGTPAKFADMACGEAKLLFNAVSTTLKDANNRGMSAGGTAAGGFSATVTPASMNAKANEFWGKQK